MKVCLPFYQGDAWLALRNLEWYQELDGRLDYDCILCSDDTTNHGPVEALAKQIFRSVKNLKYPRASWDGRVIEKWPWQQNNAFANTARFMAAQREPWIWVETDTTPLCAGWLKTLEAEYLRGRKPFGGHLGPVSGIFNGVAIYPPNPALYSEELLMAALVIGPDNYQPPWDYYCSNRVRPHLHVMNHVMQHLWNLPDTDASVAPTFPDRATVERWLRPGVVLFHRCKDGTLMDRLRELRGETLVLHGKDVVHPPKEPVQEEVKQAAPSTEPAPKRKRGKRPPTKRGWKPAIV